MSSGPSTRTCGSCTLCCKVLAVPEVDAPAGVWCAHCTPGAGCGVYDSRPSPCRTFSCVWLMDQSLAEGLRPDHSKVVLHLSAGGGQLTAQCDPTEPHAWRREPIHGLLRQWARIFWGQGRLVAARAGDQLWVLTPTEDIDLGCVSANARLTVTRRPDGGVEVKVADALGGLVA